MSNPPRKIYDVVGDDTIKFKFVSSGDTFNPITSYITNESGTVVGSAAMSDSGGGLYYHNFTMPNSPGFYVQTAQGYVNSLSYKRKVFLRVVTDKVGGY